MKNKLIIILTEVINEIGDLKNLEPYKYKISQDRGSFNVLKNDKKYPVKVTLSHWDEKFRNMLEFPPAAEASNKPIYALGYDINGDDTQVFSSDIRTLLRILKTVSEILEFHISKLKDQNPIFAIFATDKKGAGYEDQQKLNLYRAILSQNIPQGWRMGYGKNNPLNVKFLYLSK